MGQVQGHSPDGSATKGNPLCIAGIDDSGTTRACKVDTSGRMQGVPAKTAFDAEVAALTGSWTQLFDFSGALGAGGVIFIFNDGPNPVRLTTDNTNGSDQGLQIASGGNMTIDNPGGQKWFIRTVTANQVVNAATLVEGFWTGA